MAEHGFDKYKSSRRPRGGKCAVCGQAVEGRVVVTLQAREKVEGRGKADANQFRFPAIDSRSASFCERHAVEIYETAKESLPSNG